MLTREVLSSDNACPLVGAEVKSWVGEPVTSGFCCPQFRNGFHSFTASRTLGVTLEANRRILFSAARGKSYQSPKVGPSEDKDASSARAAARSLHPAGGSLFGEARRE